MLTLPLVTAGFWYGRNLILTGNPLYPLQVTAFGRVWLPGWYGRDAMSLSPYYISVGEWRALADILLMMYDPRLAPSGRRRWRARGPWGDRGRNRGDGSGPARAWRC